MGRSLSEKEKQILVYIRRSLNTHGFPPTIRDIGNEFGIQSTNGVRYYLKRLETKGYLRRNPRISRGIFLVENTGTPIPDESSHLPGLDSIYARGGIPVLGRVAAGAPMIAEENVEEVLYLHGFVAQHRDLFALRVKGDSMVNAGILDGDVVVVRSQSEASNGEIVVALLDGEATVKRFHRSNQGIALLPENPTYTPIILSADAFSQVKILGRVTAVLRRYD
jgi:repressor LexA